MKPIFTVHAGEYLVGSYLEKRFKECRVWIPSKDTGIDLLVTDPRGNNSVSLQVKFSKDYMIPKVKAAGWWTLNRDKLAQSEADRWVFVLHTFRLKRMSYVLISPRDLLRKLTKLRGNTKILQSYIWVTREGRCWETRGLNKAAQQQVIDGVFSDDTRDLTRYLDNWDCVEQVAEPNP